MRGILVAMTVLLLGAAQARADLIVQATATPTGGGLFHFEFSIENDAAEDVVLVSIDAPPGDATIAATLVAPVGFSAQYDSGLGIVDFLEDTQLFAVGTITTVSTAPSVRAAANSTLSRR